MDITWPSFIPNNVRHSTNCDTPIKYLIPLHKTNKEPIVTQTFNKFPAFTGPRWLLNQSEATTSSSNSGQNMDVPHRFSTIFSSSTHHCNTTQFRGCTVKYSPPYADKPQLSLMNACRKEYFQLRISMATYNFQS